MTKYAFKFPRVEAETILVDAEGFGEAADKAVALRMQHATPVEIDGKIAEQKPSLVSPAGAKKD